MKIGREFTFLCSLPQGLRQLLHALKCRPPVTASLLRLIILLTVPARLVSQVPESPDTTRIISYSDRFIIKANLNTQDDSYFYTDKVNGQQLKVSPNIETRMFLSLDYEFIGVSFGFSPDFLNANNDEASKGKTSFADYQFRLFLGKWVQTLQYRNIKGYYIDNTGDFVPDWQEGVDPYLQFPDLRSRTFRMGTSYVFNPRFSYRNVVYQTEWQKKSAGSFVPTFIYDYHHFSIREEGLESVEHNLNFRIAPSYFHTFVWRENWFFSVQASPSVGLRFANVRETSDGEFTKQGRTYFTRFLEGGMQLGYSSDRVIFGASFNLNVNWYNEGREASVENDQYYGLLYIGYRFNAPGFIDRPMKKLSAATND